MHHPRRNKAVQFLRTWRVAERYSGHGVAKMASRRPCQTTDAARRKDARESHLKQVGSDRMGFRGQAVRAGVARSRKLELPGLILIGPESGANYKIGSENDKSQVAIRQVVLIILCTSRVRKSDLAPKNRARHETTGTRQGQPIGFNLTYGQTPALLMRVSL
jgi:hypothetical protein